MPWAYARHYISEMVIQSQYEMPGSEHHCLDMGGWPTWKWGKNDEIFRAAMVGLQLKKSYVKFAKSYLHYILNTQTAEAGG